MAYIDPDEIIRADNFINASERDAAPANDEGRVPKLESDGRVSELFLRNEYSSIYTPSDNLIHSNDSSSGFGTTLVKAKEIRIDNNIVNVRMKVSIFAFSSNYNVHFYANGSSVYSSSGTGGGGGETTVFSFDYENIILKPGDLLQVYAQRTTGSSTSASNFRLYGTLDKKFISKLNNKQLLSPVITVDEAADEAIEATNLL